MAEAAFREMECVEQLSRVTWLARVGWRDFTAYDSANNILRNANALAAGYISGAGVVESLPYDLIAELPLEEHQRAQRLTLTTQLVLQQESMLGEVADPASGGFLLEHLTRTLGEQGWAVMQKLQALPPAERAWALGGECDRHWEGLQKKFRTRRLVQTGVNDFPDAHEALHIRRRWLKDDHVRLGRSFEELRQALKRPVPSVAIAVVGDYAALQARLNFTRNYFELLGLSVCDSGVGMSVSDARAWLEGQSAAITAWVAKDEDHVHCLPVGERCYLAGKSAQEACHNIHAGQDVLAALEALVLWWGGRP